MAKAWCRLSVDMEGWAVDQEGWWVVETLCRVHTRLSEPRRLVFRALDMMVLMLWALKRRGWPALRARLEPVSRRPGSCSQALLAQPLVAEPELGTPKDAGGAASSLTTLATPRLASGMGAPVVGEHGAVDSGLGWLARQGPPDQQVCHEAGCGSRQVVAPEVGVRLPGQLLQPAHPARPGSAHGTWLPSMGQGVWS